MKQEHRLVAEIYRYLAPFIDTSHDLYLSLDGQAATSAVKAGHFVDADIPDMWFTLVGATLPIRIEAKVLDGNRAMLMQSQLAAWRSSGGGAYKPEFWVAANREFKTFYFWHHADFLPSLDQSAATGATLTLAAPKAKLSFATVPELALHLLRVAHHEV
ncbi:hypothetical protein DVT68_00040 [Dyella solisilvae]|uniref:Uncharacterized protein n=1 Tax=Dyella solisilvae TaxID=1920168 RepID=A0A370K9H1_9GAMM|nr:hypothetical protein [Dyella solisilvae]RDI99294.1 hypothetical protein DVT68_00040 [Dyella solisilvae]